MDISSSVLLSVYDAALSDQHWPRALGAFAGHIGSLGAILIAVDQVGLPFQIEQATYAMDQVRYYFDNYGHYDVPAMSGRLAEMPPFTLVRDCDVWGDVTQLEDRADYKWLRENIGARCRAGVRLSTNKGWMDLLALQFEKPWDQQSSALAPPLQELLPHLAKAVEINRQFSILRARYQAALAALDYIRIGSCVLSDSGHVILANSEARRIHDLGDGFQFSRAGSIACLSSQTTAALAEKIRDVIATAEGAGTESEVVLLAERKSGARPFIIELAPLRDSLGELENGLHGALLFVVDPENHGAISTERLCRLFALTDAEAEVCRHMIGALSAQEIAEIRNVAEDTVRSQFKAVYAKTGVRRRADLVRLALTVDPPIGPRSS